MRTITITFPALLAMACARPPAPAPTPPPPPPEEDAIFLTVENATPLALGVFFAEQRSHTRLGHVDSLSTARLRVGMALLKNRSRFRVYAFRGPEPCPVARMIDLTVSRTPRIIVTTADTVVGDYLPGDACRLRSQR